VEPSAAAGGVARPWRPLCPPVTGDGSVWQAGGGVEASREEQGRGKAGRPALWWGKGAAAHWCRVAGCPDGRQTGNGQDKLGFGVLMHARRRSRGGDVLRRSTASWTALHAREVAAAPARGHAVLLAGRRTPWARRMAARACGATEGAVGSTAESPRRPYAGGIGGRRVAGAARTAPRSGARVPARRQFSFRSACFEIA
jgi:hypothetical protein